MCNNICDHSEGNSQQKTDMLLIHCWLEKEREYINARVSFKSPKIICGIQLTFYWSIQFNDLKETHKWTSNNEIVCFIHKTVQPPFQWIENLPVWAIDYEIKGFSFQQYQMFGSFYHSVRTETTYKPFKENRKWRTDFG